MSSPEPEYDMSLSTESADSVLVGMGTSSNSASLSDSRPSKIVPEKTKDKPSLPVKPDFTESGTPPSSPPSSTGLRLNTGQFTFGCSTQSTPFSMLLKPEPLARPIGKKHERYYLKDGNMTFLVQGVLFKIHKSVLAMHSARPRWMKVASVEPSSDTKPINLGHITALEFERFLWILYPPVLGETKTMSVEEWISILELGTYWELESLRLLAAKSLCSLSIPPVEKIVLWQKFNLDKSQLGDAYKALCTRPESLTLEENYQLGMETVTLLAKARERFVKGPAAVGRQLMPIAPLPGDKDRLIGAIMQDVFG